jgi:hypothetical protein
MNEDTLVVVHGYAGDRDRVVGFLPWYLHHGCPVLVLSPADAPIQIDHPDVTCRSAGLAGWKGWQTLERQIAHLEIVAGFPQKYLLLNDSDSMCLTPELPSYLYDHPDATFFSNEAMWQEPGAPLVPPYFFTQGALARMLAVKDEALKMRTTRGAVAWSDPYNDSPAIDALYIELVRHAGLEFTAFPDGVHRETVHPHDLHLMIGELLERGARFVHSVKRRETLDVILMFHRERERLLQEEACAASS